MSRAHPGSSTVSPVDTGPGGEVAFAAALDGIHPLLHLLELQANDLGLAVAPLYIASARGSLRHVAACLAHQRSGVSADGEAVELFAGSGVGLVPVADRDGIGERRRVGGSRREAAPRADVPAWAVRRDLGSDLASSADARELCRGPIGSALLSDALASHRWLHLPTRSKWSTDVSGARAVVTILNRGADFPIITLAASGGLVDGEVADLLAGLGWSRMLTPRMPGHAGR